MEHQQRYSIRREGFRRRTQSFDWQNQKLDEEIKKKTPFREIPISLKAKRRLLYERHYNLKQLNNHEHSASSSAKKFGQVIKNVLDLVVSWDPTIILLKKVEANHGSGIGSYFKLLRRFLYTNIFVTLITFLFLIFPAMTIFDDTIDFHRSNATFSFSDIFLGNGYFEDTILFYGASVYSQYNSTGNFTGTTGYSIQLGYFWVTAIGYVIYFVSILVGFMSAYKKSFVDNAYLESRLMGSAIFTSWQMSIQDEGAAKLLKTKLLEEFRRLQKEKGRRKNKSFKRLLKTSSYAAIAFVLLMTAVLAGICYGTYELVDAHLEPYVLALVLSLIVLIVPLFPILYFKIETQLEESEKFTHWYIGFVITSVFEVAVLSVVQGYWTFVNDVDEFTCAETSLGQELYRIIMFFFWINIILYLIFETVYCQSVKIVGISSGIFSVPRFNVSYHATNLIYCQFVTLLGYYFCPLLPLISSVIMIVMLILHYVSLNHNNQKNNAAWMMNSTRTIYMIMCTLSSIIAAVFYIFTVTVKTVKSNCGPFPAGEEPIQYSGIVSSDSIVSFWIYNSPIWAGITVITIVIYYYMWTLLQEQRNLKKFLLRELAASKKEVAALQRRPELRRYLHD